MVDIISMFGNVQVYSLKKFGIFFFYEAMNFKLKGSGNCQGDFFGSSTIKFIFRAENVVIVYNESAALPLKAILSS